MISYSVLVSTENFRYSCFSRPSTWLCPGHKFWSAFYGLWFQSQFRFQRLCSAIPIWPMCPPCSGQSGALSHHPPIYSSSSQSQCMLRKPILIPYLLKMWVGTKFYQTLFLHFLSWESAETIYNHLWWFISLYVWWLLTEFIFDPNLW